MLSLDLFMWIIKMWTLDTDTGEQCSFQDHSVKTSSNLKYSWTTTVLLTAYDTFSNDEEERSPPIWNDSTCLTRALTSKVWGFWKRPLLHWYIKHADDVLFLHTARCCTLLLPRLKGTAVVMSCKSRLWWRENEPPSHTKILRQRGMISIKYFLLLLC